MTKVGVFGPMRAPVLMAIVLIGSGVTAARAQDVDDQSRLQFLVTPYFWASGVNTTINTPNPNVPNLNETVDFNKIFNHLAWVPFMGAAELRYGPFGGLVDFIHVPLRVPVTTRNVLFSSGTGTLSMNIGTATFLYRAIATPNQSLDAGVGVRAWGLSTTVALNPGLLPGTSFTSGGSVADPLVALRYHYKLGNGFGFTVYGDVGGFGLAAHSDWQVLGTIDYAVNSWIDLHAGYRSLNINYTGSRSVGFDVAMRGPILGATFRF